MAQSVNRAIIVGNLGKDPEVRNTTGGLKIVNLTVATSDSWVDKSSGEKKESTEWHRVSIMNEALAGVAEKYLRKGSKVYLSGKIVTRKWQDKDGADKYSTEIVIGRFGGELVLLDRREGTQAPDPAPRASGGASGWDRPTGGGTGNDMDGEIPFAPCWQ
jgi:single-strand DNA-binding protein